MWHSLGVRLRKLKTLFVARRWLCVDKYRLLVKTDLIFRFFCRGVILWFLIVSNHQLMLLAIGQMTSDLCVLLCCTANLHSVHQHRSGLFFCAAHIAAFLIFIIFPILVDVNVLLVISRTIKGVLLSSHSQWYFFSIFWNNLVFFLWRAGQGYVGRALIFIIVIAVPLLPSLRPLTPLDGTNAGGHHSLTLILRTLLLSLVENFLIVWISSCSRLRES